MRDKQVGDSYEANGYNVQYMTMNYFILDTIFIYEILEVMYLNRLHIDDILYQSRDIS